MVYLSLSREIPRAGKHKTLLNKWTISIGIKVSFFLKIKEKKTFHGFDPDLNGIRNNNFSGHNNNNRDFH